VKNKTRSKERKLAARIEGKGGVSPRRSSMLTTGRQRTGGCDGKKRKGGNGGDKSLRQKTKLAGSPKTTGIGKFIKRDKSKGGGE